MATRDHSQELPVDLLLLFTDRLFRDNSDRSKSTKVSDVSRKALFRDQTSCAVQWCLLVCRRPDEVLCVGLCITLMGKVFSYMLVQELFAMPPLKMQRCY